MKRSIEKKHVLLYNLYRLVVLTSLLVSAFIIQFSSPDFPAEPPFYYLILGWPTVLGPLSSPSTPRAGRSYAQAYVQVVFDLLLITAFVYISGGIASSMYFLYLFPIIAASLGHLRPGGLPDGVPVGHPVRPPGRRHLLRIHPRLQARARHPVPSVRCSSRSSSPGASFSSSPR